MTPRMESFAAWTGARQSLGTGASPLLPLLAAVFTKTDKDQSHRLKEEHKDQQIRTWQIWKVWERAGHLPGNHGEYSFLRFSLISLSELQKRPGYHFAPCSLWLASRCFGSKEQNKLCVLLHTLVQACWDLRG